MGQGERGRTLLGERLMGTTAHGAKGQGKRKGSREGKVGQGGRGWTRGGERLMGTTAYGGKGSKGNGDRRIGAASCRREEHTMATCQPPPPPWPVAPLTHCWLGTGPLLGGTPPLVVGG